MLKNKPKRKTSSLAIFSLIFLVLIIIGISGFLALQAWYHTATTTPASDNSATVNVVIKNGTSAIDIGKILKENGVIQDELAWQLYVKLNNPNFLADTYDLPHNLSMETIVKILVTGQEDKVIWVTIPEGLRMDEIETILDSRLTTGTKGTYDKTTFHNLINSPDTFLTTTRSKAGSYISSLKPQGKSLEGFLFPDTYAFRTDISAESVLTTLLENFMAKTKDSTPANGLDFYANLTLASIVEREASPKDYSGVAGVFLKRLAINERLGSDITVLYIFKRWTPEPTAKELALDSPYNTRKNYGLPPTPISNPGVAAISATEQAKPGDYLFFLADANGVIHYGKTAADHQHNVCKYLTKTCQ